MNTDIDWKARAEAAEAENIRLRAALAQSELPCVYCALPADEWAKCKQGFPGCGRADDVMGCPELGNRMRLVEAEARVRELESRLTVTDEMVERAIAAAIKAAWTEDESKPAQETIMRAALTAALEKKDE